MKIANKNKDTQKEKTKENTKSKKDKLPGYKPYPDDEDIFSRDKETDIDPEKLMEASGNSESALKDELLSKRRTEINDGLDVPGSELDDELEIIGDEDEENNYYSLGGDNHNDLDEDKS